MFKDRTKWLLLANTVLPTDSAFQELAQTYNVDPHIFYNWIIEKRTKTKMPKLEIAQVLSKRLSDESEKILSHAKQETIAIKKFIQEQEQAVNDIVSFKMKLEKLCEAQSSLKDIIELLNFKKTKTSKVHTLQFHDLDCALEYNSNRRTVKRNIKK